MRLDEVMTRLSDQLPSLQRFGVVSLSVFGSFARGEADRESDIDLLVEFSQPIGLFDFVRLRDHLEALLGRPVDLVTPDALHPALRGSILSEAVHAA